MKQDMIVILDWEVQRIRYSPGRFVKLGAYGRDSFLDDITEEEIKALDNVKGIILNGGENRVVDRQEVEVRPER